MTELEVSKVPVFDGSNWTLWKRRVTIYMKAKKIEYVVGPLTGPKPEKFDEDDNKVLQLLFNSMSDQVSQKVLSCSTASEVWSRLHQVFENRSPAMVGKMYEKYYSYKKSDSDDMAAHIAKVEALAISLESVGEKVSEVSIMSRLLYSLSASYASLMVAWDSVEPARQTRAELVSRLLSHDDRKCNDQGASAGVAFMARMSKPARRLPFSDWVKTATCHKCGKTGHLQFQCRKGDQKSEQSSKGPTDKVASQPAIANVVFAVGSAPLTRSDWLMDSGASNHICNNIELFSSFIQASGKSTATVGDGNHVSILGKGTVEILCKVGDKTINGTLQDVAYIPDLAVNLFSQGAAEKRGLKVWSENGVCQLMRGEQVVAVAKRREDNLYLMEIEVNKPTKAYVVRNESTSSWHEVLGHASSDRIKKLVTQGMIKPDNGKDDQECGTCPAAKGKRVSHPSKTEPRSTEVGERVFCDLVHLNKTDSDYCYYFLCKDECSEYCLLYPAKTKTDVPLILAKLLIDFERGSGCEIRTIMTDNGSEIKNKACELELARQGIRHVLTGTYCPQQNGIVEREVQSINNMARAMILGSGVLELPVSEAIRTACYVRNRLPTSNSDTTPYERFTGKKPTFSHLHVFGEPVHVIREGERLTKMDPRTVEGYFVGYTVRRNTFRCWLPHNQRVVETCDVVFRPHLSWRSSERGSVVTQNSAVEQRERDFVTSSSEREAELNLTQEEMTFDTARGPQTPDREERRIGANGRPYISGEELDEFFRAFRVEDGEELSVVAEQEGAEGEQPPSPPPRRSSLEPIRPANDNHSGQVDVGGDSDVEDLHQVAMVVGRTRKLREPANRAEALESREWKLWQKAEEEELQAHADNGTWEECERPPEGRPLTVKWVYSVKKDREGKVERYKARLVARGFEQVQGRDYNETYAPVVSTESLRLILAVSAIKRWQMSQFDVSTAFLNGVLEETVYVEPPSGVRVQHDHCLRLRKALYGLKQSPKCWNSTFTEEMRTLGFKPTVSDQCVFFDESRGVVVLVYVDDGLIFAPTQEQCQQIVDQLQDKFKVKTIDSGRFLGMELDIAPGRVELRQTLYIEELLERFSMVGCGEVSTPMVNAKQLRKGGGKLTEKPYRQLIGSLQHIASKTRPDIVFAVNFLSRFLACAEEMHWEAAKRVVKYLATTIRHGIVFEGEEVAIKAYSDADFANDEQDRKSVSGVLILIGDNPIVFTSKRQSNISLSTAEAEYVAACDAARDLTWIRSMLTELKIAHNQPELYVDNESAINQIKNNETLKRSKHVELKYHYVREKYRDRLFSLRHVDSKQQLADSLTKATSSSKLRDFSKSCNIRHKRYSSLLLLATIMALSLPPSIADLATVRAAEPILWTQTDNIVGLGNNEYHIVHNYHNPCVVFEGLKNKKSSMNLRNISIGKLQELCDQTYYDRWVRSLNTLEDRLSYTNDKLIMRPRLKREIISITICVLVLATAIVSSAVLLDSKINAVKGEVDVLKKDNHLIREALEQMNEVEKRLIDELEFNMNTTREHGRAIEELAASVPDVAWQASSLYYQIMKSSEALDVLTEYANRQMIHVPSLTKLIDFNNQKLDTTMVEIKSLKTERTLLHSVARMNTNTIVFRFQAEIESNTTKVFKVSAFDYFTFLQNTTAPVAVRYAGPEYLIHNESVNCTRGIEKPESETATVFEACEQPDYKDPNLERWIPIPDQSAAFEAPPQIKRSRADIYVYCPMEQISFGRQRPQNCPTRVMQIKATQSFKVSNYNHIARVVNFNTTTYIPSIKDTHVNATFSDAIYDYYHDSIRRAKEANNKAAESIDAISRPEREYGLTTWLVIIAAVGLLATGFCCGKCNSHQGFQSHVSLCIDGGRGNRTGEKPTPGRAERAEASEPGKMTGFVGSTRLVQLSGPPPVPLHNTFYTEVQRDLGEVRP